MSLWRVECKVFGSKFEWIWMENEDDNNGVQVRLNNEGLERWRRRMKKGVERITPPELMSHTR